MLRRHRPRSRDARPLQLISSVYFIKRLTATARLISSGFLIKSVLPRLWSIGLPFASAAPLFSVILRLGMTGSEAAASPATQLRVGVSTPPNRVGCSSEVAVVSARSPGLDCGDPVVSATGCWDLLFFSASLASRSQTSDILIRLTLVSGSQLLRAISAQCAACSRYAATFSLPDIRSPTARSCDTGIWSHCTMLTG